MYIKSNLLTLRINRIIILILIAIWTIILFPNISNGQDASDVDPSLAAMKKNVAPVKIDGVVLFYISGTASAPAEQRAVTISNRIEKVAANPFISENYVKITAEEDRLKIYAGEEFLLNVYDADAKAEGMSRTVFGEVIQKKISAAITSYRHERSRSALVEKSLYAICAAAIMAGILFLLLWIIRRINTGLQNRIKSKIDTLENKSFNLIRSNQLWKAIQIFFKTLNIFTVVVVIALFLQYILGLFPWTNSIAAYTLQLFLNPIISAGNGFIAFLPSLAFLIVIFLVTRYLLKLIRLLFAGLNQGGMEIKNFDPEWAMPTYKILRIFVIAFAVIIAYPYIPGSDSNAFKGVSVFLGVLFSLGSSSFIGNVIAGYSMTYRRAFKKGDRIEVDGMVGFVEEQKLLVTRLRSHKNEEIVIPNSVLLNSHIINYSAKAKESGLILHTSVGIGYETPWRQVDAMLKLAADRTEGLLKQPQPFVLKKSLGDFAVNYEINAYCNDVNLVNLYYSNLHQHILDVFNENNVQIMTPAYEGDPETPKVVPRDQWNTPLAS
ncbi:MAG: mechanosensitive ion channel domain-containing protein [Bacteroidota bacterium]